MNNYLEVFSGKRVFVTGHNGFKGAWLTLLLVELGAEVVGYSLPDNRSNSTHFVSLGLSSKMRSVEGDTRDLSHLKQVISDFQPEFVFHLAAQPLVKESYINPVETCSTNIMGAVNLMESVRHCKSVRALIYVTTDKCYENKEWIWGYRESDAMGGHDPYSASKGAAEILFSAYARSFFASQKKMGAATVRAGNVIGGGDWSKDRIIPDCVRAFDNRAPIEIRSPYATRPWQHVLEPISGYMQLAAKLYSDPSEYSGAWNFGPSVQQVRTVQEVTETIISHMGFGEISCPETPPSEHEAQLLQLNCDKANLVLGWYPRWDVDKTLEATALWYKSYLAGDDTRLVSRKQLHEYFFELELS
ncbi:MAG: CDP-glucose 4,6-dehydratase [Bdellovibrionales bacterium]|jgi:CDP-glucose 4,6-dehydratase|nr:CDP-glucose 4,6-dehydratase [Bdellovibrionales bacterium]MBT3525220.1 CDP-glucose 4,6-dehydratase [Bdellovibrionales bacterium]MBT7668254.1 CDP-glucose 4,6-dehydratase [Bdellovibrionales bacterium]